VVCIPLAAKSGDNVVTRSAHMDWYVGPTLLRHLEDVDVSPLVDHRPFRMPVQWINRPNPDFRGIAGLITSGEVHAGMPVRILPSGRVSRIARIATFDGDLDRAPAGRSVTLTLADAVDVSRGDMVAEINHAPMVTEQFTARVFWMDRRALVPGRNYLMKLATASVMAKIEPGLRVIDLDTGKPIGAGQLAPNEIGVCSFKLDREVAVDRYAAVRETGSFILIDPESYDTIGMGCIEKTGAKRPLVARRLPRWIQFGEDAAGTVALWKSTHTRSLAKAVLWRAAASVITVLLVYGITGSSKLAATVAGAEIMVKILTYYFHERAWMNIHWGKR
jgi:sulfate adenylyltransferase subunit 1 (EFTu-like GTPase family)/uncharacterized membrane protein